MTRVAKHAHPPSQREELTHSNRERQQFACAVSHDRQEPRPMVSSYGELLASHHRDPLDADVDDCIAFAVKGATRVQREDSGARPVD